MSFPIIAPLALLLSSATYPRLRLTKHRLQENIFCSPWFCRRYECLLHFCVGGHRFFPRVNVILNVKPFDVLFDNKLSIIGLYLFYFFACFFFLLLESKDDQCEQQFFQTLSYYQERKVQKSEASISETKYTTTEKLEMGKTSAFSLFQHLGLVVSQVGNEMEDGNVSLSMKRKGKYSRIIFWVKITQLFIISCLKTL